MDSVIFLALALTVADIHLKIVDLQKEGQGHKVQFCQLHHSTANAKIYKFLPHIFELTRRPTGLDIYKILKC